MALEYSVDDVENLNGSNQDASTRIQTLNFKLTDYLASPSPDRNKFCHKQQRLESKQKLQSHNL